LRLDGDHLWEAVMLELLVKAVGEFYKCDQMRAGVVVSHLGDSRYEPYYVSICRYPEGVKVVIAHAQGRTLPRALRAVAKVWMPGFVSMAALCKALGA
jgi:hypothetical protein